MVCLGRPYRFAFFKSCLSQILRGPFIDTLMSNIILEAFLKCFQDCNKSHLGMMKPQKSSSGIFDSGEINLIITVAYIVELSNSVDLF